MKKRKAKVDDDAAPASSASATHAGSKRRKTNGGRAVATGTRRTTRSQKPGLIIEMIAKVASFANYGADLMNICLAVGRKDSAAIRYACLRKNMRYFEHLNTDHYVDFRTCCLAWMEINFDWRRLCTADRVEDDRYRHASTKDEATGEVTYSYDPLILFNNPFAAIEYGLLDVLKHLVEVVGIDMNGCKWSGYTTGGMKPHLLAAACSVRDDIGESCFNYLLSRPDLDVCSPSGNGRNLAWESLFFMDLAVFRSGQETFEAINPTRQL